MDSQTQKAVPSPGLSSSQPVAGCCHWSPNPNHTKPVLTDHMPTMVLLPAPEPCLSLALF